MTRGLHQTAILQELMPVSQGAASLLAVEPPEQLLAGLQQHLRLTLVRPLQLALLHLRLHRPEQCLYQKAKFHDIPVVYTEHQQKGCQITRPIDDTYTQYTRRAVLKLVECSHGRVDHDLRRSLCLDVAQTLL